MRKTVRLLLLFLCLAVTFMPGPARAADKPVKEKDWDTLVYAMPTEPDRLDPVNDNLLTATFVSRQIFNTLVVRNLATGEIEPSLATKWEWTDGTTLVMDLRDDVLFHNGDKFTAEDALFSLRRACNGLFATMYKAFDSENSRVLSEYKIEIKMKEPYGPALNMLAIMRAPMASKKYAESVDDVVFGREPVGTGPFKFVSWTTGDSITLVRNDQYWGKKPSYTNLILRIITEVSARAIELETGGVDIVETLLGDDIVRYRNGEAPGVKVYTVGGVRSHWLAFNEDDPILSNEKVRQAFAHALNIEEIVDMAFVLGSGAEIAYSSIPASLTGYQAQPPRVRDAEKAKQLLAEAGYPDGFTCSLVIPESAHNVRMGEAIQAQLSEVGINMEVTPFTAATWMSMGIDGSSKLSIMNLTGDSFDPDQYYSSHLADSANKVVRTYDETVNRLIAEGRRELDFTKRMAIYAELQKYIYDHAVQVDIDEPIINYATRDYIEGLIPDPGVQPDLSTVVINH